MINLLGQQASVVEGLHGDHCARLQLPLLHSFLQSLQIERGPYHGVPAAPHTYSNAPPDTDAQ